MGLWLLETVGLELEIVSLAFFYMVNMLWSSRPDGAQMSACPPLNLHGLVEAAVCT
jgi:hypothetical protein